ncbi:hypothetical protein KM043_001930 [Ampulex compressa]|uniref:CLIP domain-containing serine protease n=1 Tax=Ampulex compressa TaxID=860918 RepID=A0A1W6EWF7_AMPCP|nr:serine protease easter-like protein [Ampulex compressa]KAG7204079.1 hypothetical protein KM043_001930 [Ampulex compressa]
MTLVAFFVACFIFYGVKAQESCITPLKTSGTCINIRNCQPLVNILRRARPLSQQSLEFLRNSQCGFEGTYPKVCCEDQIPGTVLEDPAPTTIPDPPDVTNHPNLKLLNYSICGPITEQKLHGGNKTGVFDFPWMTLIAYDTGRGIPEFRCGGSIIHKRYILTAAHCVTSLPEGLTLIGVRVGDHDISTERDCDKNEEGLEERCAERYQDFGIASIHSHPLYRRATLRNDIALIRVDADIDFRPRSVRPICLPVGPAVKIMQGRVTVTGWGATEDGPRSLDLLRVNLTPMSTAECSEVYKNRVEIWYKQMCAGGKRNIDACLGDSGGPLQSPNIYNNDVVYMQYGIVSFGLKTCGVEGVPGVYTNVPYYMDWILNTLKE